MAIKELIKDGLLMTVVASTMVGIFYALRIVGVGQHNALLTYIVGMAYVFTSVEIKYNFFDLMIKEPYIIK